MNVAGGLALIFPPSWYYTAVPADLTHTGGFLHGHGVPLRLYDWNAGLTDHLFGGVPAFEELRRPGIYGRLGARRRQRRALRQAARDLSAATCQVSIRRVTFPGLDQADVEALIERFVPVRDHPGAAFFETALADLLATEPRVVALACVHPEQRAHVVLIAGALRRAGYDRLILLYGSLEDVLAPADFADDLAGEPPHRLFDLVDGVVVGDAEGALAEVYRRAERGEPLAGVPNLITAEGRQGPTRWEDLRQAPPPLFAGLDPQLYAYPSPLVDLRLGRGCPWGRCAFCAIQAHHPGYRWRSPRQIARTMAACHRRWGSLFFRFRDDLLTRRQFIELAEVFEDLPFRPRWCARARFEPTLTREVLARAMEAGLEELWLGLEAGSERIRSLMDKGVSTATVERILTDAAELGLRIRALCMVGFPGETVAEVRQTLALLERHRSHLASIALTPFQLMKSSPMAARLEAYGLERLEDPLPRQRRLRHTIPCRGSSLLPQEVIDALLGEAARRLAGTDEGRLGPDLAHDWIDASISRRGWEARPTS